MNKKLKAAGLRTRTASILHGKLNSIRNALWVLQYSLEEARQRYADRRQLLRQAAACIALALLRLAGVWHA